jgi:hypothetical protein
LLTDLRGLHSSILSSEVSLGLSPEQIVDRSMIQFSKLITTANLCQFTTGPKGSAILDVAGALAYLQGRVCCQRGMSIASMCFQAESKGAHTCSTVTKWASTK